MNLLAEPILAEPILAGPMLAGLRVLDLSEGTTASLAAALLGDFGADVVRCLPADPRTAAGAIDPDWLVSNRGKRLALTAAAGSPRDADLARLLQDAHVVIADSADLLAALGLTPESLGSRIALVLPPYDVGWTPWAGGGDGAELLSALSGLAAHQASSSGEPVEMVYPYLRYVHAAWAATCAVAALLARQSSGQGQVVSVSGLQAADVFCGYLYSRPDSVADVSRASGPGGTHPTYRRYQGADGRWFLVGGLGPKFALAVLAITGTEGLLEDPRLDGRLEALWAPENSGWVIENLEKVFDSEPAAHWMTLLGSADIPCTLLRSREEWFAGEQVAASGLRQELIDPVLGPLVAAGLPVFTDDGPPTVRPTSPGRPLAQVQWLGPDTWAAEETQPRPLDAEAAGPLAGIRIASLGSYVAGPYTGSLLAGLGADVVKVEPPQGDPWRLVGFAYNWGARSLAVDLRSEAGNRALLSVLDTCDLVLDNFRFGVLERLGISHAQLAARGGTAATLSVTAYGESGPLAHLPGYDVVAQAASGMMTAMGGADEPVMSSVPSVDHTTAALSAFAGVLALLHRARTGTAIHLSTSLVGTALYLQAPELLEHPRRAPGRSGGRDYKGPGVVDRIHRVADGFVRIRADALDVTAWRAAGLLLDAELAAAEPGAAIAEVLATLPREQALRALARAGVPAAAVRGIAEIVRDPVLHNAGALEWFVSDAGVRFCVTGRLAGFSRSPQWQLRPAPGLGEHTREVLADAGCPAAEILAMEAGGQIICGGPLQVRYLPPYR